MPWERRHIYVNRNMRCVRWAIENKCYLQERTVAWELLLCNWNVFGRLNDVLSQKHFLRLWFPNVALRVMFMKIYNRLPEINIIYFNLLSMTQFRLIFRWYKIVRCMLKNELSSIWDNKNSSDKNRTIKCIISPDDYEHDATCIFYVYFEARVLQKLHYSAIVN